VQDNAGVAEVCNQTVAVPGVYNVITVEIRGFLLLGCLRFFEVEITAIPTVDVEYIEFIGGSPNI